jgi:hypothetical protein
MKRATDHEKTRPGRETLDDSHRKTCSIKIPLETFLLPSKKSNLPRRREREREREREGERGREKKRENRIYGC